MLTRGSLGSLCAAITGTAKDFVMKDYGARLGKAYDSLGHVAAGVQSPHPPPLGTKGLLSCPCVGPIVQPLVLALLCTGTAVRSGRLRNSCACALLFSTLSLEPPQAFTFARHRFADLVGVFMTGSDGSGTVKPMLTKASFTALPKSAVISLTGWTRYEGFAASEYRTVRAQLAVLLTSAVSCSPIHCHFPAPATIAWYCSTR